LLPNHSKHNHGAEKNKKKEGSRLTGGKAVAVNRVSENGHRSTNFPELAKPQTSRKEKSAESQKNFFLKKEEDAGINGAVPALREAVVPWSVYPSPKRHVSQQDGKPSCPIMATKLNKKKKRNGTKLLA
jgi:hypothetical protein